MRKPSRTATILILMSLAWGVTAQDFTFRQIMQDLDVQMSRLTQAIMSDDMKAAEAAAAAIADHPRPSLQERKRIMNLLGNEAPAFRNTDTVVHDTAVEAREAAKAGNRNELVESFHDLTDACIACHTRFRDRLRESNTK